MKKWYFTFGLNQGKLSHKYVVIENDSYSEARKEMEQMFGSNWAFNYSEDDWTITKNNPKWDLYVRTGYLNPDDSRDKITVSDLFNLTQLIL